MYRLWEKDSREIFFFSTVRSVDELIVKGGGLNLELYDLFLSATSFIRFWSRDFLTLVGGECD